MLSQTTAGEKRSRWLVLALLAATCAWFAPALGFGFVYDDLKQVLGNRTIQGDPPLAHYDLGNSMPRRPNVRRVRSCESIRTQPARGKYSA